MDRRCVWLLLIAACGSPESADTEPGADSDSGAPPTDTDTDADPPTDPDTDEPLDACHLGTPAFAGCAFAEQSRGSEDPSWHIWQAQHHDDCGRPVELTTYFEGAVSGVVTMSYTAEGRLAEQVMDYEADGVPDAIMTLTYDGARLLELTIDHPQSGISCTITHVYVDADDFYDEQHQDCFGEVGVRHYTWDAARGLLVRIATDVGGDGTIDATLDYTHDAEGHVVEERYDTVTGVGDYTRTSVWSDGMLAQQDRDEGDDGTIDETTTFTYDAMGRQLTSRADTVDGYFFETDRAWSCPGA